MSERVKLAAASALAAPTGDDCLFLERDGKVVRARVSDLSAYTTAFDILAAIVRDLEGKEGA